MNDVIIDWEIICNCGHKNKFKVSGEEFVLFNGGKIAIKTPEEEAKERFCEECGRQI